MRSASVEVHDIDPVWIAGLGGSRRIGVRDHGAVAAEHGGGAPVRSGIGKRSQLVIGNGAHDGRAARSLTCRDRNQGRAAGCIADGDLQGKIARGECGNAEVNLE